jgi:hypothetical protein
VRIGEKETSKIEFDVFFGYLDKKRFLVGQEVTINWAAHQINSHGLFYTDSNAYRVSQRNVWKNKTYPVREQSKPVRTSSYFYPVNSGLFIEDKTRNLQMTVMNDRP